MRRVLVLSHLAWALAALGTLVVSGCTADTEEVETAKVAEESSPRLGASEVESKGVSDAVVMDRADGMGGGPDLWQLDLDSDDSVAMRLGPSASDDIVATIDDGTVLRNLGCTIAAGVRWCRVALLEGHDDEGWLQGRFLRGAAPSASAVGMGRTISGDPGLGIPDLFIRPSGEIEVRWTGGCTALYDAGGSLITAGSSCSDEQRRQSDERIRDHRSAEGD